MKDESAIEKYLKAKRSGGYRHPESEKIYNEAPTTVPPAKPKEKLPLKGIALALALLLGASGTSYLALQEDPKKEIDELSKRYWVDEPIDTIEVIDDDPSPFPESQPDYVEAQMVALEKIRAWERVTRETIKLFYKTPVQEGRKRTLCITLDGQTQCRSRLGVEE